MTAGCFKSQDQNNIKHVLRLMMSALSKPNLNASFNFNTAPAVTITGTLQNTIFMWGNFFFNLQ